MFVRLVHESGKRLVLRVASYGFKRNNETAGEGVRG